MATSVGRQTRPDMVASAVSFLRDDKVQQSSVSQRVSFLESKGLTPDEIDEAMRQTGGAMAGPSQISYPSSSSQQHPMYYAQPGGYGMLPPPPPQQRDRDWRDWFIMAVVSGTVGYGVISLARKYLVPHLQPPNQTVLEEDKDALTARYDEVAAQLAALDAETKAVKAGVEEQREKIERSIADVEQTVKSMRESDKRRSDDMDAVKSEVDAMKESMARMFDKTKEAQTSSLNELQNELKSLKTLLVSRNAVGGGGAQIGASASSNSLLGGGSSSSNNNNNVGQQSTGGGGVGGGSRSFSPFAQNVDNLTPSASSPSFTSTRPSIPAWQLADSSSSTASASPAAKDLEDSAAAAAAAAKPASTTDAAAAAAAASSST